MTQMTDQEKLRLLLSHWIDHNGEHAAEYKDWTDRLAETIPAEAVAELQEAIEGMDAVNRCLSKAMAVLGGPVDHDGDHHGHSHHH
jgi:hypothetical protein